MKTKIITLVMSAAVITGAIFTACDTSGSHMKNDQVEAQKPGNNGENNVKVTTKYADDGEWDTYRQEIELQIQENKRRIAEIRDRMKNSGEVIDDIREKKIANLEATNNDLEARLRGYDRNNTDWESFKSEFNRDMEALGKAIGDLGKDNKK